MIWKGILSLKKKKDIREYRLVEIDVGLVDKIIPMIIVDDGSSINIMPKSTINKLDLKITLKTVVKVSFLFLA